MTSPLSALFSELDTWLAAQQHLWNIHSFHHLDWPWCVEYPELCTWLDQQTHVPDAVQLEEALKRFVPNFQSAPDTSWVATLPTAPQSPLPSYFNQGIKGRKWQQITAFSHTAFVDGQENIAPIVEWCAGKGHLGKVLNYQYKAAVHSLEWQSALCEVGAMDAARLHLEQTFTCTDVLKGEGKAPLSKASSAVALHACGDLHRTLIEQAIAANVPQLSISPCCYHLTRDEHYLPLSKQAQNAKLKLNKDNLKLAVKEVATAGQREQRLKQTELAFRLGFDAWQRHAQGRDKYLNVPSCPKALLNQGFTHFCHWAAEQKQLTDLLERHPLLGFEAIGAKRAHNVALIESISQYFRRPLELWLVLDRALCLEEVGYQVMVGEFCDKTLTPRNLMIKAVSKPLARQRGELGGKV